MQQAFKNFMKPNEKPVDQLLKQHHNVTSIVEFSFFSAAFLGFMVQMNIRLFHEKDIMIAKDFGTRYNFFHGSAAMYFFLFVACIIACGMYAQLGILKIYDGINKEKHPGWLVLEGLLLFAFGVGFICIGGFALSNAIHDYQSTADIKGYIQESTNINLWKTAQSQLLTWGFVSVAAFLCLAALHWGLKKKVEDNPVLKWITVITKLILAFVGVGALMVFLSFIPTQMFYSLCCGLHSYAFIIGGIVAALSFGAAIIAYKREEEPDIRKFAVRHPFLLTMMLLGLGGSAALIVSNQMPIDITMNDSIKYMGIGFCCLIGGVVIKDIVYLLRHYVFKDTPEQRNNRNPEIQNTKQMIGTVVVLSAFALITLGCGAAAITLYLENTGFMNHSQSHSMYALFVTAAVVTMLRVGVINFINNQEPKVQPGKGINRNINELYGDDRYNI